MVKKLKMGIGKIFPIFSFAHITSFLKQGGVGGETPNRFAYSRRTSFRRQRRTGLPSLISRTRLAAVTVTTVLEAV